MKFSLKTLFVIMLLVLAYFGGWAQRQREIDRIRAEIDLLRNQLEVTNMQVLVERESARAAAAPNAWRDDVIEYLQDQGVVPSEPSSYERGRSGIEAGMKIDALERRPVIIR